MAASRCCTSSCSLPSFARTPSKMVSARCTDLQSTNQSSGIKPGYSEGSIPHSMHAPAVLHPNGIQLARAAPAVACNHVLCCSRGRDSPAVAASCHCAGMPQ